MKNNIILMTDSYKASHFNQYPPGTEFVSSYIEARVDNPDLDLVFFGLQVLLIDAFSERVTLADVLEAESYYNAHGLPFNKQGWIDIIVDYNGYPPLRIEALPEGTVTKSRIPLVQVRNTDPRFPWLTSYFETAILRAVWYATTIATVSREAKKVIKKFLDLTSEDPEGQIMFKLHDFGARGVPNPATAGVGGAAHLVNFMGTDTVEALRVARHYYHENMAGFSVPASEHSTMTSWGRDKEVEAYRNMLVNNPTGIVSIVADSYDFRHAVDYIFGEVLRPEILARDGTLVIRPDSGDPIEEVLFALESLGSNFGFTTNSKGFKVLNPKVRVLQGDGIDVVMMERILKTMAQCGWSADNVVFGMGGGLLQKVNRDTFKFAMKASAMADADGWHEVQKDPKTDPSKQSKKGIQYVVAGWNKKHEVGSTLSPADDVLTNLLKPVYLMDKSMGHPEIKLDTFANIRARAKL